MSLANRIQSHRERLGLSRPDLAERCAFAGDGQRRIRRYETAEREPGIDEIAALAAALDISIAELVTGDTSPTVREIPLDQIHADPEQPRHIDLAEPEQVERIANLASSMRQHGVLQPITVRPAPDGNGYTVIYGERRCRAARQAERQTIPAIVRTDVENAGDRLAVQILENLQRVDLTMAEVAGGLAELARSRSHYQIANELGRSRSWVSRRASLADCRPDVWALIESGHIRDVDLAHGLDQLYDLQPSYAAAYADHLRAGTTVSRDTVLAAVREAKERRSEREDSPQDAGTHDDASAARETAEAQRRAEEQANDTSGGYSGPIDETDSGPAEVTGHEGTHAAERETAADNGAETSNWHNVLFDSQKLINAQVSVSRAVHEYNMPKWNGAGRRDPDPKTLREHIDAAIADLTAAAESLRLRPPSGPGLFDGDIDDGLHRNACHIARHSGVISAETLADALQIDQDHAGRLLYAMRQHDVIGGPGDDGQHYARPTPEVQS